MSFIDKKTGKGFEAGYFLADNEDCTRQTVEISASHAQAVTRADGTKYVPAGAIIPSNDGNAVGILYEDIDVTDGAAPGSVVTRGLVYTDRLPASAQSAAVTALTGIQFITAAPGITRPSFKNTGMTALTVQSAAGTAVGDTALTVTGYTPASGEGYFYKVATGTAPAVFGGMMLDNTWTAWNGTSDITAATGKKITVAVADSTGAVVAGGSATVTAKA